MENKIIIKKRLNKKCNVLQCFLFMYEELFKKKTNIQNNTTSTVIKLELYVIILLNFI
jgi:hypothetical protein